MIRSIYYKNGYSRQSNLTLEEIAAARQAEKGLLWVSLEHPTPEEVDGVLRDIFQFHPLAIEDTLSNRLPDTQDRRFRQLYFYRRPRAPCRIANGDDRTKLFPGR